ncbi:universal stress protein [Dokdonia sp. Hel_I_53]|uniref:universal stress protein n=1 Tax=Dokdonia sp. Hel_I_53 TaxID=1566287 RepID=UPI00119BC04C|nr:universal stress protein [Dokdonia sp. Hel_I_53]TVZ52618.1 nucleotide-binding universal stress UspA family protein [Dokdonia sp. Hel_I_53]
MKNILVPIGSSSNASNTLQYAIDLADTMDANVYAISVFQELSKVGGLSKVNSILREESEKKLSKVLSSVNHKNVSVIAHPIKGGIVEGVERFNKHVHVDLMVLSPRSNSVRDEVYLGNTTGKLIKETNIAALVVPEHVTFTNPTQILMAFKNGNFDKKRQLEPLRKFQKNFGTDVHLLHVETPDSTDSMLQVSEDLERIKKSYKKTVNATTYQGVLEHFQSFNPDIICVVRRKRGFFKKLWEKNVVLKKEFFTSKPLLILRVKH